MRVCKIEVVRPLSQERKLKKETVIAVNRKKANKPTKGKSSYEMSLVSSTTRQFLSGWCESFKHQSMQFFFRRPGSFHSANKQFHFLKSNQLVLLIFILADPNLYLFCGFCGHFLHKEWHTTAVAAVAFWVTLPIPNTFTIPGRGPQAFVPGVTVVVIANKRLWLPAWILSTWTAVGASVYIVLGEADSKCPNMLPRISACDRDTVHIPFVDVIQAWETTAMSESIWTVVLQQKSTWIICTWKVSHQFASDH